MKKIILAIVICFAITMLTQVCVAQTDNSNQSKIDSLNKVAEEKSAKIIKDAEEKRLQKSNKEAQIKAMNDSIATARKELARKNNELQEEKAKQTKQRNDSIAFEKKKSAEIKAKENEALKKAVEEKNRKIEEAKKSAGKKQ